MTIVLAAGGTGGHLYPAVALAREFLRLDPTLRVVFVGTGRGLEAKVLSHEGFELQTVAARPVAGSGLLRALWGLLVLPVGLWQSVRVLRSRRVSLVLGIGGYASPPVLLAAFFLRIPRAILEPNAYPGLANKFLAPVANLIFLAFDAAKGSFNPSKVKVCGTPVRAGFLEPYTPDAGSMRSTQGRALVVFGGSQGAHGINNLMIDALPHLQSKREEMSVVHQTGEADLNRVHSAYEANGVRANVVAFLFDMPRILRSADLVVARAGAMTVAELIACGKAAILIPLPSAIYQHQESNARAMEREGAAVVLLQHELTGAKLAQAILALLEDPVRLRQMGERGRALWKTNPAGCIVQECLGLMNRYARDSKLEARG
ncbi:MAG: undecaprenyldiphospho-muramoylpentapeptide beta-N-acetylglucosaminyltransferase [Nitrospiraceae bacterium]